MLDKDEGLQKLKEKWKDNQKVTSFLEWTEGYFQGFDSARSQTVEKITEFLAQKNVSPEIIAEVKKAFGDEED